MQSAIDLLDQIIEGARQGGASADKIANEFFRSRRYMGSGDRRAVRELTWRAIREFGEVPASGRAAMLGLANVDDTLATLFTGATHAPASIKDVEPRANGRPIPEWLIPRLYDFISQSEEELSALLARAPLDIRYRGGESTKAQLKEHFTDVIFSEHLPAAARLSGGTRLEDTEIWRSGAVEVQDWGSQAICDMCPSSDVSLAIDLCAGAGGKTLGLAAKLPETANIVAADVDRRRLSAMSPRLERAGVSNVVQCLMNPGKEVEALAEHIGKADLVLIDAPCSGTGTWRRNPETRWRINEARLDRLLDTQAYLLDLGAQLVRPGGSLVYATCSLLKAEGANQVSSFLNRQRHYIVHQSDAKMGRLASDDDSQALGTVLTPFHDETDGFFFTRLKAM